jgi:uncharacterized membrane protein (UPF0127 family)
MKSPFVSYVLRASTWLVLLVLAAVILFFWREVAGEQNAADAPSFPRASMTLQRVDGKTFPFDIEVATTPEQETYGLMFRRSLARDAGMLFLWPSDQMVIMWMKNTFIPLDMLYVRHDGTIAKIITNAEPLSLTPLSSDGPVRAVVEINAGEATRRELKPGDKVVFPALTGAP